MKKKTKNKWRWLLLRRGLIGLAILITLAGVLVTEENWRGKRAWETYKRDAIVRGERFDWTAFAPTNPVPDDQNFIKAPIFSGVTAPEWDDQTLAWKPATNLVDRLNMSPERRDPTYFPDGTAGSWELARLTNLKNWQDYYRNSVTNGVGEFPVGTHAQSPAADVLLALSKYDSAIEELRAASRRPYAWLGEYPAGDSKQFESLLKYLAKFKRCTQVLSLRAIAELGNNQSTQALEDVQLLLRLGDALRQEPLLITHLVNMAITSYMLLPIYEGLAQHRWNDAQLAELEHALAPRDFLADYQFAMRGEQVFATDSLENQRITRKYETTVEEAGKTKEITVSLRLMPSAYFYQNELAHARLNEQFLRPLVDVTNRLVRPAAVRQAETAVKTELKHYLPYKTYKIHAGLTFPAISKAVAKFAYSQSSVDLARVACALERFRLANGNYPESLDPLAPQFIAQVPHDVINGQPLHYRRTDDGRFVLYSVGWDEKDDGGQPAFTKSGSVDRNNGDWVWRYPAE
jgi:hypothetical protein